MKAFRAILYRLRSKPQTGDKFTVLDVLRSLGYTDYEAGTFIMEADVKAGLRFDLWRRGSGYGEPSLSGYRVCGFPFPLWEYPKEFWSEARKTLKKARWASPK